MNDAPPPKDQAPTKQVGSPLVYFGIGCGVLAVLAVVGFVIALQWGMKRGKAGIERIKTTVEELEKNPAKAAAETALRLSPDLELVDSNERKSELTFRIKKTGETGTISYEDAAKGNFSAKTSGTTTTFKAGEAVPVPAWVPSLPGLETGDGSVRRVSNGREYIRLRASTEVPVEIVAAFYNRRLSEAEFTVTSQQQTAGVFATHMLQAKDDAGRRTVTISITHEKKNAPTTVVLAAEGPVAEK